MQYIHLSDDSYIIHLPTGLVTLTRKSFNFYKIKKLIGAGITLEELTPLLVTPELPDGIYEAYLMPGTTDMLYMHTSTDGEQKLITLRENKEVTLEKCDKKQLNTGFIGIYASLEDLMDDWPEYLF